METVLIIGGCKSGKSRFALELAGNYSNQKKIYIATSIVCDEEMEDRVKKHKKERGDEWETLECAYDLPDTLNSVVIKGYIVLVDCLTMWVNNLFYKGLTIQEIEVEIEKLLEVIGKNRGLLILVSNEVGLGIVPLNELTRKYRDVVGIMHQKVAKIVDKVYFVTCGIPNLIKG